MWHKECRKKKTVIGQLDNSDFFIGIYTCDFQFALADLIAVPGVETVITAELLRHFLFPIRPVGQRAWCNVYLLSHANERTRQFADQQS